MSSSTTILIKFKTISSGIYELNIPPTISINDLKKELLKVTSIEVERQRIIYRGKVLKDQTYLNDYNINNNDMLHLVIKAVEQTQPTEEISQALNSNGQPTNTPSNNIGNIDLNAMVNNVFGSIGLGSSNINFMGASINSDGTMRPLSATDTMAAVNSTSSNGSISMPSSAALPLMTCDELRTTLNLISVDLNSLEAAYREYNHVEEPSTTPSFLVNESVQTDYLGVVKINRQIHRMYAFLNPIWDNCLTHLENQAQETDPARRALLDKMSEYVGMAMRRLGAISGQLGRRLCMIDLAHTSPSDQNPALNVNSVASQPQAFPGGAGSSVVVMQATESIPAILAMGRDGVNRTIPLSRFQNPAQPQAVGSNNQDNSNFQLSVNGQAVPNPTGFDINALFGMLNSQMNTNVPAPSSSSTFQPATQTAPAVSTASTSSAAPIAANTPPNSIPPTQPSTNANPLNNILQNLLAGAGGANGNDNPNNLLASLMPMVSQIANNMNANSTSNSMASTNSNAAASNSTAPPNPLNNMMMNMMPMMNQMFQMSPLDSGNNNDSADNSESGILMRLFSVIMNNLQIPEILGLFVSGNVYIFYIHFTFYFSEPLNRLREPLENFVADEIDDALDDDNEDAMDIDDVLYSELEWDVADMWAGELSQEFFGSLPDDVRASTLKDNVDILDKSNQFLRVTFHDFILAMRDPPQTEVFGQFLLDFAIELIGGLIDTLSMDLKDGISSFVILARHIFAAKMAQLGPQFSFVIPMVSGMIGSFVQKAHAIYISKRDARNGADSTKLETESWVALVPEAERSDWINTIAKDMAIEIPKVELSEAYKSGPSLYKKRKLSHETTVSSQATFITQLFNSINEVVSNETIDNVNANISSTNLVQQFEKQLKSDLINKN